MKKILGLVIGIGMSALSYADGLPNIIGTKTVNESGILTYTIDYKNIGVGTATNVLIYDQIPDGTEYILNTAGTGTLHASIKYSNKYPYNWQSNEISPVIYILWEIGTITPTNNFGSITFAVKRRDN